MGSGAAWNSQTSLVPDTSPGKCGVEGAQALALGRLEEALVRRFSGLKIPQELVGFRQLSGEEKVG